MTVLKQLGAAALEYAKQHDGQLPESNVQGDDSWANAALPAADAVWYNALPRLLKMKSAGDFARENRPAAFYTAENLLYLPKAQYPEARRLDRPFFAVAMNTKLKHRNPDGSVRMAKLSEIQNLSRTVLFFECGLPDEPRANEAQSKKDYTGAPKGGPVSFVARYQKRGLAVFGDGHVEELSGKTILTPLGTIPWSSKAVDDPEAIFWKGDPREDPNVPAR
jgi:hypothetical protein